MFLSIQSLAIMMKFNSNSVISSKHLYQKLELEFKLHELLTVVSQEISEVKISFSV